MTNLYLILLLLLIVFNWNRDIIGLRWFLWLRKRQKLRDDKKVEVKNRYRILLPALEEQPIVDDTLNYFSALVQSSQSRVRNQTEIIVITGESEDFRKKQKRGELTKNLELLYDNMQCGNFSLLKNYFYKVDQELIDELSRSKRKSEFSQICLLRFDKMPSTKQLVEKWIKQNHSETIKLIHCPYKTGGKSSKLNYAVDQLSRDLNEDDWIGIYDFDSRPDSRTLESVYQSCQNKSTAHVQQIPMEFNDIAHQRRSSLEKITLANEAIFHIQRGFAIEFNFFNLRQNNLFCQIRSFMGAGMFFRYRNLVDLLPFPDISDDITMGYRFQFAKLESEVIPMLNSVQMCPSLKAYKNQSFRIFNAALGGIFSEWNYSSEQKYYKNNKIVMAAKSVYALWAVVGEAILITLSTGLALAVTIKYRDILWPIWLIIALYLSYGISTLIFDEVAWQLANKYYIGEPTSEDRRIISERFLTFLISFGRGFIRSYLFFRFLVLSILRERSFMNSKTPR